MILKDSSGIHIVPVEGIPNDTILIAVPAEPWEKQMYGISLERSIVIKNVKVDEDA